MGATVFYGIFTMLPYILSGLICLVYTLTFIWYAEKQQRRNAAIMAKFISLYEGVGEDDALQMSDEYARMTFASRECLASMANVRALLGSKSKVSNASRDN